MEGKVLVAYASKRGSTKEIAEKIAEIFYREGAVVDVTPANQVRDLVDYDVVVLGSAVYYGRWQKEAVNFLKTYEGDLSEVPVWFFSSGPLGEGDPVELLDGWQFPPLQQAIADRIQPRGIAVFHGVLIQDKLNFFEKSVLNKLESPVGDFRDWDAITSWAGEIVRNLG